MVLARKESTYTYEQVEERKEERKQGQIHRNKKRKKSYRFEKILITMIIAIIFICSIFILTRFTAITEARNNVNNLEKQLEKLEVERTKLKVEVEKVSKSGWIESEARNNLQMDYPTTEQMINININPAKVAMLTNEINKLNYNDPMKNNNRGSYGFLKKLTSYIKN